MVKYQVPDFGILVVLPLPPDCDSGMEMEIYVNFMRHLRHSVYSDSADGKILASISFTAGMLDHSEAFVSKVLVDLGLRAPRRAFPQTSLDYFDNAAKRNLSNPGFPVIAADSLARHWEKLGCQM